MLRRSFTSLHKCVYHMGQLHPIDSSCKLKCFLSCVLAALLFLLLLLWDACRRAALAHHQVAHRADTDQPDPEPRVERQLLVGREHDGGDDRRLRSQQRLVSERKAEQAAQPAPKRKRSERQRMNKLCSGLISSRWSSRRSAGDVCGHVHESRERERSRAGYKGFGGLTSGKRGCCTLTSSR